MVLPNEICAVTEDWLLSVHKRGVAPEKLALLPLGGMGWGERGCRLLLGRRGVWEICQARCGVMRAGGTMQAAMAGALAACSRAMYVLKAKSPTALTSTNTSELGVARRRT